MCVSIEEKGLMFRGPRFNFLCKGLDINELLSLLVLFIGSGWFVDVPALFTDVSCSWGLAGLLVMAADVYIVSSSLVFLITS